MMIGGMCPASWQAMRERCMALRWRLRTAERLRREPTEHARRWHECARYHLRLADLAVRQAREHGGG